MHKNNSNMQEHLRRLRFELIANIHARDENILEHEKRIVTLKEARLQLVHELNSLERGAPSAPPAMPRDARLDCRICERTTYFRCEGKTAVCHECESAFPLDVDDCTNCGTVTYHVTGIQYAQCVSCQVLSARNGKESTTHAPRFSIDTNNMMYCNACRASCNFRLDEKTVTCQKCKSIFGMELHSCVRCHDRTYQSRNGRTLQCSKCMFITQ